MAFRLWQTGLEIQADGVRALALVQRAGGARLYRWWYLPLPEGCVTDGRVAKPEILTSTLRQWRAQLPLNHEVRFAFPASRTLVRQVPAPAGVLREPDCERYVAGMTARQLGMASSTLCLDYRAAEDAQAYTVTAAQEGEVAILRGCASRARLNLVSVTPDAGALSALLPWLAAGQRGIVIWHENRWAYAGSSRWGWGETPGVAGFAEACRMLGVTEDEVARCNFPEDMTSGNSAFFDPWCVFTHMQPPLPSDRACWAVAIALAVGRVENDVA